MATVACPACGIPVPWSTASRYRPFCSERCKLIDLGAWATDKYAVVGQADDDSDEPADPSDAG